jgi:hypothetical protein
MPITNTIKITPNVDRPEADGPTPQVTEGIYDAEIVDIDYVSAEQNSLYGKPQLKFRFRITDGEFKGVMLASWVGMSMSAGGWDKGGGVKGKASNLYIITVAVMGEEPDPNTDFYPSVLMGGKLKIWVEIRPTQNGKQFSRIVKYSAGSKVQTSAIKETDEDVPLPDEPHGKEDVIDVEKIPF